MMTRRLLKGLSMRLHAGICLGQLRRVIPGVASAVFLGGLTLSAMARPDGPAIYDREEASECSGKVNLLDFWPIAIGNVWVYQPGNPNGITYLHITGRELVNKMEVWSANVWFEYLELPVEIYMVQADGWMWSTSTQEDLTSLPVIGGDFCRWFPLCFSSGDTFDSLGCNPLPASVTVGRFADVHPDPLMFYTVDPDTPCAYFQSVIAATLFVQGIGPVIFFYSQIRTHNLLPDASVLSVTSPNGGEHWAQGSQHAITWDLNRAYYGNAAIYLYNNWTKLRTLATVPITGGTWTWVIPADEPFSLTYRIRVKSTVNAAMSDYSDNVFAIGGPPGLTVTSPNGAESWPRGTQHAVTWTSANLGGNARVYLYTNWTKLRVLATVPIATGAYTWNIPASDVPGGAYRIRVQSQTNTAIQDYSNALFAITP